MKKVEQGKNSESHKTDDDWTPDLAFQAWKHFASVGGADKNTMVTVASWLLGFSATIIGYIVTKFLKPNSFDIAQPVATFILAGIGFFISGAAGFVALLYGGYANWNWARANDIANDRSWTDLQPDNLNAQQNGKPKGLTAFAARLADPNCAPTRLAPIFLLFFRLAVLSALVHLAFLIRSICLIK